MSKLEANRAVVRNIPQTNRIEIALWSHGAEMVASLTEEEALQKAADILNAIAANREANGGV